MKRHIIKTEDGSHSFYVPELDEHFHSTHGAIQESQHVFIQSGLKQIKKETINIFEVGFGTGLNTLLTIIESDKTNQNINYYSIEKYPLTNTEYTQLNYSKLTGFNCNPTFLSMHDCEWGKTIKLTTNFLFTKIRGDINAYQFTECPLFDLIYYDAFAPNKQNGVWDKAIFELIYKHCAPGAVLVTYCARGEVRRTLQSVGFKTEKVAGPPGKREMLRAIK
ncbi:MAG: tRNA (5-methylaminomethyl-2-thiouridine)(34)-methyltransferase MnmD [Prolixibacteraceae bacterium]|jgi:tRNA U34 5-methylaminomethyl-2-thiouridine-forming methyltransferase MnmC|nr:tRNA (5-methylaminomethyl-2-thiouridine)(34)-methyltransferase MnmD [Prolixibacteraceae bacterium]